MNENNKATHKDKREFLSRIARMYYFQGMSQHEIAQELNVGRSSVARFLAEARSVGIVTISIESEFENFRNSELESKLIKQFSLDDCLITNGEDGIVDDLAVEYLDNILPYKGILGVAGGRTTYALGQKIWANVQRPNLEIVQMIGSIGNLPETSVTKLYADALNAKGGIYLPAPLLVKDVQSKNILLDEPNISNALNYTKKLDSVIVGIGCNKANDNVKYLKEFDFIDLEKMYENTVGDLVFHFFNEKGEFNIKEVEQRVVGISIKDFLEVKQRIGIAYNIQKSKALAVALKHKLITILITNSKTVQAILDEV